MKRSLDKVPPQGRLDVAAYRIAERLVKDPLAWQLLQPAVQAVAHDLFGPRTPAGKIAARLLAPPEKPCKRR